jgi:hypothetical protein
MLVLMANQMVLLPIPLTCSFTFFANSAKRVVGDFPLLEVDVPPGDSFETERFPVEEVLGILPI